MSAPPPPSLDAILRLCAEAAPEPWYPSAYVRATGVTRDSLDPHLDQLRLGGLIRLTDWVQGFGQGYTLTEKGKEVLDSPRALAQLRNGVVAPRPITPPAVVLVDDAAAAAFERAEAIRAVFLQPSTPFVTLFLIAANVLVFVAGMALYLRIDPNGLNLYLSGFSLPAAGRVVMHQTGALDPADVLVKGEWWRLLTCCFVHFGLLHLGVNMYGLYVIGPHLERMWGHLGFLVLYLLAGIGGSCTVVLMSMGTPTLLAGASGALWGLMASEVAWLLLNRAYLPPPLVSAWLRQLLFVFILNAGISFLPRISASAHFGGGATGLVVGMLLNVHRFEQGVRRTLALLALLLLPLLAAGAITWARTQPQLLRARFEMSEELLLPQLEEQERKVYRFYQTAIEPLLHQPPQERNPEAVNGALDLLDTYSAYLSARAVVVQADPFGELLMAESRLFSMAAVCLRKGPRWTNQDEDQLDEQRRLVQDLRQRWRQARLR